MLTPLALFSLFCMLILASESAPTYSVHDCTNQTFYQPNTTFRSNLNTLLSSLTSNSSLHSNNGFYRTAVGRDTPDVVNGLFLCRGDVNATVCHGCVAAAATNITLLCPNDKEAIIWYDVCMLRYSSSTSFNNIVPGFSLNDEGSVVNSNREQFNQQLAELLNELADKAASASSVPEKKFAAGDVGLATSQTLYGMAQCVPELTTDDCVTCFRSGIASLPACCNGSEGVKVLLPACNIRYQLYPFLYNTTSTMPLAPFPSSGSKSTSTIVAIVVPIGILVALLVLGCCCWWRRRRNKKHDAVLELNHSFRSDFICEEESLHFDLATIEAATCRFSIENKIGEGGFGVVYKGTLPNGQEIAVKRLSKRSLQGDIEFKNEASLVAQLQHRNLVRLLGFCLERTERILVYEFIPNSSLDHFLFDHDNQGELDWARRYKIITGIARGIQYLHEDSRLRIIHRDLKASNVLLDANMNPKISDFGMAKIFHDDQVNTATKRIVGTFGYMSPEYAMHGRFSVKSDVFSFGVLVSEIISGKRNTSYHQSHQDDDLLSFAWKNWTNRTPFLLLDPKLRGSYSKNEVRRCIHIALLCVQENPTDRPSMATIMLALNSYSVTLALPRQPASFLRGRNTPDRLRHQLDSDGSTSSTIPLSKNDSLITEVYPR